MFRSFSHTSFPRHLVALTVVCLSSIDAWASFAGDAPEVVLQQSATGPQTDHQVISLSDAVSAALVRNPELAGYALEARAREAEAIQAAARPNPELRGAVENVGGSGQREGTEAAETTLLLSQLIELGGKRMERRRVASLRGELAGFDYDAKRLAVLSDTTKAFVTTLAAQERARLSENLERVADDAVNAAERRVRAGASAPAEGLRARVVRGRAALEHARAAKELDAARQALAAMWGDREAGFERVAGALDRMEALPSKDDLVAALDRNPEIARWTKEHAARRADLALERARRVPDVTVAAGGRYFSDSEDAAMVFEFGLPLPLFDRNKGAIAAAERRLEKAALDQAGAAAAAHAALSAAYGRLVAAHEQAVTIRERVLPDAEAASHAARDALRSGLFHALDVLDAERTLFEVRMEHVRALEDFHLAAADVERLTAQPLSALGKVCVQ